MDLEGGARAGRVVQREAAAEGLDPVPEPDQAGALGGIRAAAPVVADADPQHALTGGHGDRGGGGAGVPGGVGQRLGDHVVGGDLHRLRESAGNLDIQVTGRLPDPVEIAAYYVVSEALTNTARHAAATAATVQVSAGQGTLCVCVRDDGRGGATFGRGSGLVGLRDRVEALVGRLTLRDSPGGGTTLDAHIPIGDGG